MKAYTDVFDSMDDFSGLVQVTLDDGDSLYMMKGDRRFEEESPINEATVFGIASGTKGFTALAVLKLIEAGKVGLDDPVFELLPYEFANMDRGVTVRHLLSHTSGIYDYFDEDVVADFGQLFDKVPIRKIHGPSDMYPLLIEGKQYFKPGSKFKYCNSGYVILGMLIEEITGMSYAEWLGESVIKPLMLKYTGCFYTNRMPENAAIGYEQDENGWYSNIFEIPMTCTADGGLFSTAQDMEKLWSAVMEGDFLSQPIKEQALKVQAVMDGNSCYGLGFYIDVDDDGLPVRYALVGEDPGVSFISHYFCAAKKTMTILSNTSEGAWPMSKALRDIIQL